MDKTELKELTSVANRSDIDPRLVEMSTHKTFEEISVNGFKLIAYPSNVREPSTYWTLHILLDKKLLEVKIIPRLDHGEPSHHDITKLGMVLADWTSKLSNDIYTVPSLGEMGEN